MLANVFGFAPRIFKSNTFPINCKQLLGVKWDSVHGRITLQEVPPVVPRLLRLPQSFLTVSQLFETTWGPPSTKSSHYESKQNAIKPVPTPQAFVAFLLLCGSATSSLRFCSQSRRIFAGSKTDERLPHYWTLHYKKSPDLVKNIFVPSHVESSSNLLPIGHHDSIPESTLRHSNFNVMSQVEEVIIHQKNQAVSGVLADLVQNDVSTLSISTRLIGNAEHFKDNSGPPP